LRMLPTAWAFTVSGLCLSITALHACPARSGTNLVSSASAHPLPAGLASPAALILVFSEGRRRKKQQADGASDAGSAAGDGDSEEGDEDVNSEDYDSEETGGCDRSGICESG
jgi:hypothetical protein